MCACCKKVQNMLVYYSIKNPELAGLREMHSSEFRQYVAGCTKDWFIPEISIKDKKISTSFIFLEYISFILDY